MTFYIEPDCNETVAKLPGVHGAVLARAERARAKAAATLARHKGNGDDRNRSPNHSRITVTNDAGYPDVFLNLEDPDGGAIYIEFGARGWHGTRAITGAW